ncbi:hypothetical protein PybrP1_003509 [[Pythium] brassicae (nom. inval.)]|nr:hypothetical protein PybrP1_003509 [[Pythium] brassicae (nom. inval.)]
MIEERHHGAGGGAVLCRYFFQQTLVEDSGAPPEHYASALLLSSEPTLAELRRKFPFAGRFHFRLQHALNPSSSSQAVDAAYCWLDLREPHRVLPVAAAAQREIRVKVLQLWPEDGDDDDDDGDEDRDGDAHALDQEVDVPEDRQFAAYFRAHDPRGLPLNGHGPHHQGQPPYPQPPHHAQDVASVLSGVKKALASKMKQSAMAQSIQKTSAKMWEKVVAGAGGGGGGSGSGGPATAPPTAAALAQLAKLIGALQAPLHDSSREHVEMLNRLWAACFDSQPFALRGAGWDRLGLSYGDPVRELQAVLPLHCLVFFHEVHRGVALAMLGAQAAAGPAASYPHALVGVQVAFVAAELLQLKDGACLGSERPFWRVFEDPLAFFELFSVAFRAFDQSWRLNAGAPRDIGFHLGYVADFAQELLRRSPETVSALVEYAHQMQNW